MSLFELSKLLIPHLFNLFSFNNFSSIFFHISYLFLLLFLTFCRPQSQNSPLWAKMHIVNDYLPQLRFQSLRIIHLSFSKQEFICANFVLWQRFWHLFVSNLKLIQNIFSSQIFAQFKLHLSQALLFLNRFRALEIHIFFITDDIFCLFVNFPHFCVFLLLFGLIVIQFGD